MLPSNRMNACRIGTSLECQTSQCIDWYSEGESRIVETAGFQIEVRFVGRKGRRARIAITAPTGAVFRELERKQ
jgi:hypothetical protein